jgi:hypothetical protein
VLAVAVGLSVLAHLGLRAQAMARAQTAADAAALAALPDDRDAARRLAAANGGELLAYEAAGGAVRVEVAVAGEQAVAVALLPAAGATPALAAALDRAGDILGDSAMDSVRLVGPHGSGGVEVPRHVASRLASLSHRTGLCRAGDGRPLHFVVCSAIHR